MTLKLAGFARSFALDGVGIVVYVDPTSGHQWQVKVALRDLPGQGDHEFIDSVQHESLEAARSAGEAYARDKIDQALGRNESGSLPATGFH
jgi:hypothetical protein